MTLLPHQHLRNCPWTRFFSVIDFTCPHLLLKWAELYNAVRLYILCTVGSERDWSEWSPQSGVDSVNRGSCTEPPALFFYGASASVEKHGLAVSVSCGSGWTFTFVFLPKGMFLYQWSCFIMKNNKNVKENIVACLDFPKWLHCLIWLFWPVSYHLTLFMKASLNW